MTAILLDPIRLGFTLLLALAVWQVAVQWHALRRGE